MTKKLRLIVTGGGTGGHVYPALEIARSAKERGYDVQYFGSFRGQEGDLCDAQGIPFEGFSSAPMVPPRSFQGLSALLNMGLACLEAVRAMRREKPDVIFATGGYSAAPVLYAARSLRVPYVLLDSNSVPGRTTKVFAGSAKSVCTVFRQTEQLIKSKNTVRTGQPVRGLLREAAKSRNPNPEPLVLVIGGSQGAAYLNAVVPAAAVKLPGVQFAHASGKGNFGSVSASIAPFGFGERYQLTSFFEAEPLMKLYQRATVVVSRSGGILAEFAAFGIPGVYVPLPESAGDHQLVNAQEFEAMGAATIVRQAELPDANVMANAIRGWIEDPAARQRAAEALLKWDIPDATERIMARIEAAVW